MKLDRSFAAMPGITLLLAGLAVTLGVFLRFWNLGGESFRIDELIAAEWTRESLSHLFESLRQDRWKPPLEFITLWGWQQIVPETEAWLRMPAALWGSLALPLMFLTVRSLAGPGTALLALTALAISPFHIAWSRDVSPYSFAMMTTLASTWSLWELTKRDEGRTRWWLIHAAAVFGALWSLFLTPLYLAVQVVWIGAWALLADSREPQVRVRIHRTAMGCALVSAIGLLSLMPWFYNAFAAAEEMKQAPLFPFVGWSWEVTKINLASLGFGNGVSAPGDGTLALMLLMLGLSLIALRRRRAVLSLTLLLIFGTVGGVLTLCALLDHWYESRYILLGLPMALTLLAFGVAMLLDLFPRTLRPQEESIRRWSLISVTVMILLASIMGIAHQVHHPVRHPDWRGLTHWLESNLEEPALIITPHVVVAKCVESYAAMCDLPVEVVVEEDLHRALELTARSPRALAVSANHFRWRDEILTWGPHPRVPMDFHEITLRDLNAELGPWPDGHGGDLEEWTRTLADQVGFIDIGAETAPLLALGWMNEEPQRDSTTFRWIGSETALVHLPLGRPLDRWITLRTMPFIWEDGRTQEVGIRVNGEMISSGPLSPGWQVIAVRVPSQHWREGVNHLEITSSHAVSPASVSAAQDTRTLAIAVDWISVAPTAPVIDGPVGLLGTGAAPTPQQRSDAFALNGFVHQVGQDNHAVCDGHWHTPDPIGEGVFIQWAHSSPASLTLPEVPLGDWVLALEARSFTWDDAPPQQVTVKLNDDALGEHTLSENFETLRFDLPQESLRSDSNTVTLIFTQTGIPSEVSSSPDTRRLGIALRQVAFEMQ